MPWVAGFQHADGLLSRSRGAHDEGVQAALPRLYRHLPAPSDEEREVVALMDREQPLATLDEAIEDLVNAVADLAS